MNAVAVRPIRTEDDHRAALAEIDRLIDASEGSPEAERLEVLSVLVADYEDRHHAIEAPDPISFLEFIMESRGLTRKDLEAYIGGRSRVAEIMNRRRPLSMEMVRRLNKGLDLPADVLIQSYKVFTQTATGNEKDTRSKSLGRRGANRPHNPAIPALQPGTESRR